MHTEVEWSKTMLTKYAIMYYFIICIPYMFFIAYLLFIYFFQNHGLSGQI